MNLRRYLSDNRINLSSFAKKCGLSRPVIYRIMEGKDIWLSTALKVWEASGFAVSLEEMAPFSSHHSRKNKSHDIN